jgi:DNA-binding PadR family transcriptional regulator
MAYQNTTWKESAYLLLTALAERDGHGYALARRVRELSDGHVRVGPGTLYATLDRLLDAGLIGLVRDEVVDGRNRRVYSITGAGRTVLCDRAAHLAARAASMHRALGTA